MKKLIKSLLVTLIPKNKIPRKTSEVIHTGTSSGFDKGRLLFCSVISFGLLLGLSACEQREQGEALKESVRIGVIHCCSRDDVFMWGLYEHITDSVKVLPKVMLDARKADDNQEIQNKILKEMVAAGVQALVVSTVDADPNSTTGQIVVDIAHNAKVPIVFFNHGVGRKALYSYPDAYQVASIPAQAGLYQGELIVKNWVNNPQWDKNNDGIIQYVLLKGIKGQSDAEERSKWVAATIENYPEKGVKAQKLHEAYGNWRRTQAQALMGDWLDDERGSQIELVISNNDDMALGAIDAMEERGIKLPVFGVDATVPALKYIEMGKMTGTVLQDGEGQAEHALKIAINLAAKRPVETLLDEKVINQQVAIPYIGIDLDNLSDYLK